MPLHWHPGLQRDWRNHQDKHAFPIGNTMSAIDAPCGALKSCVVPWHLFVYLPARRPNSVSTVRWSTTRVKNMVRIIRENHLRSGWSTNGPSTPPTLCSSVHFPLCALRAFNQWRCHCRLLILFWRACLPQWAGVVSRLFRPRQASFNGRKMFIARVLSKVWLCWEVVMTISFRYLYTCLCVHSSLGQWPPVKGSPVFSVRHGLPCCLFKLSDTFYTGELFLIHTQPLSVFLFLHESSPSAMIISLSGSSSQFVLVVL